MEMTFGQKDVIIKSLRSSGRRKAINDYYNNLCISWTDLSIEEAS